MACVVTNVVVRGRGEDVVFDFEGDLEDLEPRSLGLTAVHAAWEVIPAGRAIARGF